MSSWTKKKIFIVVKTYPNISTKYREVVCTAGITENGEWIRLYPVPYRYQPVEKKFKKYDWIEVKVQRHTSDPRAESSRPDMDTLEIIDHVGTAHNWQERKEKLLPLLDKSIEVLKDGIVDKDIPGRSLGIICPKKITEFVIEDTAREYTQSQKAALQQQDMFNEGLKDLDKIPYKFSYRFMCDDERCTGHKLMIEDWEIAELYRNCLRDTRNEESAVKMVKDKYESFITKNDVHLIVGTTMLDHFRKTFVIIGVFYPLKMKEISNVSLF